MAPALAVAGSLAWCLTPGGVHDPFEIGAARARARWVGFQGRPPTSAVAQCESRADATRVDYLEYREGRFTICYSPDYPHDLDFVAPWVSRAFDLGAQKYGVSTPTYGGDPFYLTVYLPGAETALTSQGLVRMACCYADEEGTTHAEIHYLTPAAWRGDVLGGLSQPPEYYHPHYLTHETVHFFQWACCRDDARAAGYHWPTWLTEGMAESDGYRHTTEYSRTTAAARLHQRVRDRERDGVIYGENLSGDRVLAVTSVYWAGGWLMNYLADTYGDEIHPDLLRRPLADVLRTHDTTVGQLFDDLVAALAVDPTTAEYAPHVACTGRYRGGERAAFEARILNGEDRAATQNGFQQQYRRNTSRGWTTKEGFSIIRAGFNHSNFSNPLFTGPDSAPFQWRVRACEVNGTDCSRWSNTVNWTAATCANRVDTVRTGDPVSRENLETLRAAVNQARQNCGLGATAWTDPTIVAAVTPIRAVHIIEPRRALTEAFMACRRTPPQWTDSGLGPGTPVRSVHFDELLTAAHGLARYGSASILDCPRQLAGAGYTICHVDGYADDAEFVRGILDAATTRLRQRYRPTSTPVEIYLFPEPDTVHGVAIRPGSALAYGGPRHLAIYLMARSAPAMQGACCTGLGLAFTDVAYQRTVHVHEFSTAFIHHYPGYSKWAGWFVQGLEQYEGLEAAGTLWRRAAERVWRDDSVSCSRSGAGEQLVVSEPYWAGAVFLQYLADRFGERSHVRILESGRSTLAAAIADEQPAGETPCELVDRWRAWMRDRYGLGG